MKMKVYKRYITDSLGLSSRILYVIRDGLTYCVVCERLLLVSNEREHVHPGHYAAAALDPHAEQRD